jgi:hypothetical protein
MNDLVHIRKRFEGRRNPNRPGPPSLPKHACVSLAHLERLIDNLQKIYNFYNKIDSKIVNDAVVSVYYNKVAAKSNRTAAFFKINGQTSNHSIVGAKYTDDEDGKHIITHYVPLSNILEGIELLQETINILKNHFNDPITDVIFNNSDNINGIEFKHYSISKSTFQNVIKDACYIEKFDIETAKPITVADAVVTFYRTEKSANEILKELNVDIRHGVIVDHNTAVLRKEQIDVLLDKVPYLVSMIVEDLSNLVPSDFIKEGEADGRVIDSPKNEPVIGVIDTLFDTNVYFSEWVEYHQMVDSAIVNDSYENKMHGTRVSSIIVDGPRLNPELDDGCGHFRVRHFGVAVKGKMSSVTIMRKIKQIVTENPDIKVWNLSLGSDLEINKNFISIEGALLDKLQFERDIIFVIAGTNDNKGTGKRIGAPADSINSIVVNAVDDKGNSTNYSRKGPVLKYFIKPDVSYYGGTSRHPLRAYDGKGEQYVMGTSFAAPWIARKLSFLMDIMGLNREIAKALIIDSAISWQPQIGEFIGRGIVPININEIVKSKKNEIRFVLSGIAEHYETYNFEFPIPYEKEQYPFLTRVTMCYFPNCSRAQGVDYTNTELDVYFGRINNEGRVISIDKNKQSSNQGTVFEKVGREEFGKWDNVKSLQDKISDNPRGRKAYDLKRWGMRIVSKDRLGINIEREKIRFGVVVTLQEINGVNRIEDFIQMFSLAGWIVNRIDIENRINLHQKAEEQIRFDE